MKFLRTPILKKAAKRKNDWMRILKTYAPYRINVLDGT